MGRRTFLLRKMMAKANPSTLNRVEKVASYLQESGLGTGIHTSKGRIVIDEPAEKLKSFLQGAGCKEGGLAATQNGQTDWQTNHLLV